MMRGAANLKAVCSDEEEEEDENVHRATSPVDTFHLTRHTAQLGTESTRSTKQQQQPVSLTDTKLTHSLTHAHTLTHLRGDPISLPSAAAAAKSRQFVTTD